MEMSVNGLIMDSSSLMLEKLENSKELDAPERVDGCVPFSHQVAGHKYGINNTGRFEKSDLIHVYDRFFSEEGQSSWLTIRLTYCKLS